MEESVVPTNDDEVVIGRAIIPMPNGERESVPLIINTEMLRVLDEIHEERKNPVSASMISGEKPPQEIVQVRGKIIVKREKSIQFEYIPVNQSRPWREWLPLSQIKKCCHALDGEPDVVVIYLDKWLAGKKEMQYDG